MIHVEYQTNIDFQATYEKLSTSPYSVEQSRKGIITVYIGKATINLSPFGKLQIFAANAKEKRLILSEIEPYLMPKEGETLSLNAYKVHFHTGWPPPLEFEFSACKKVFRYARKKPDIFMFFVLTILAFAGFGGFQTVLDLYALNQTGTAIGFANKMRTIFSVWGIMFLLMTFAIVVGMRYEQRKAGVSNNI